MTEFKIPLRNKEGGIIAYSQVDEEDYYRINLIKWHLNNGYANGSVGRMHRFIMNAKKGDPIIDHINNDRLDNRKLNLRFATSSQNAQNKPKKEGCSSKYIGVSYHKKNNTWKCKIMNESSYFKKEEHAAYLYDQIALKQFGTEAKINGIDKPNDFIEPIKNIRILPKGINLTKNGKYQTQIYRDKQYYIGTFDTIEEAEKAYNDKKEELYKKEITSRLETEITRNKDGIAIINDILVDDDKYYDLIKYSWKINTYGYATANIENKIIRMHRYLMNVKEDDIIDHINNNRLDNRLSNLRKSNSSLNSHNKSKKQNATSKYMGICYEKTRNKYKAAISKNGITYNLGRFNTDKEAAKAYDKKAIELYGSYAKLNLSAEKISSF